MSGQRECGSGWGVITNCSLIGKRHIHSCHTDVKHASMTKNVM